jgi:cyanophycin synthetase
MELWRLRVLRGPNAWAAGPVIEAGLNLGRWADWSAEQINQVAEQVLAWLPSLPPTQAGAGGNGQPAGSLAHVALQLTLRLQILASNPVAFGEVRALGRPGRYRLAVEYQEEPVGLACLQAALGICRAAGEGRAFPVDEELRRLRDLADDQVLGPSTRAVVEAARARGIPVDHLNPEDGRYLQLGHGARQRRTLAAETDDVSAVARSVTTDKHLTKLLLRAAGVPVPEGRPAADADDAWAAACELGLPVAVKPQDRDLALGVGLDLRSREQVAAAYQAARDKSPCVLVERFAPGTEHRVLVVDGRVVAVARIEPPHVVGDGRSTVAELVEAVNRDPRRGDDYHTPLRRLKTDATALEVLAAQGHTLASVPPAGVRVLVRRNPPYLKNGGSLSDLTERIHPQVAARAVDAARALRVRVAGLDVVAEDIGRPLEEQGGVVVEVNTGPGLWLHMAPWADTPRPVGEAIVATLFPPGGDGRIPVVALTGGRALAAAGRHLAGLLVGRGFRVGRASEDSVFIAGREISRSRAGARDRARAVLQNDLVDAAVLEAPAADLLREGLGCDRCDVAVITDPPAAAEVASGDAGNSAEELGEACGAVLQALAAGGKAVLNADDPPAAVRTSLPSARVIWFSQDGRNPRIRDHRAAGGTAVFARGDALVLAHGAGEERMAARGRLDGMEPSERLGLLAAVAAGTALGLSNKEIGAYL